MPKKIAEKIMKGLSENQQKFLGGNQQDDEKLLVVVYNCVYRFIASNPAFNAINGTGEADLPPRCTTQPTDDLNLSEQRRSASFPLLNEGQQSSSVSVDENEQLVDTWLKGLSNFDLAPDKQITECLFRLEDLSLEEQDKAQWIMNSDKVYDWLTRTQSCVLEIEAENSPDDLINSMSFTDAMLAITLGNTIDFPVLSFFCGLRRNNSFNEQDSGAIAVLKSLNGQLLKFILQKRPTVNLSFLEKDKYLHKSKEKPRYASRLFKKLLDSLPEKDAVFILLDSFSRIFGDKAQGDKIIEMIGKTIKKNPHLIIKLLVSDPLPNCPSKNLVHLPLYVPDDVDGWQCGINMEYLKLKTTTPIKQFQARQKEDSTSEESDEESDESDW